MIENKPTVTSLLELGRRLSLFDRFCVRRLTENACAVYFDGYLIQNDSIIFSATGGGYWLFNDIDSIGLLDDNDCSSSYVISSPEGSYIIECGCVMDDEEYYVSDEAVNPANSTGQKETIDRCPICGCTAHVQKVDGTDNWYVSCSYCPLITSAIFHSREEAVDYWNDRDVAEYYVRQKIMTSKQNKQ